VDLVQIFLPGKIAFPPLHTQYTVETLHISSRQDKLFSLVCNVFRNQSWRTGSGGPKLHTVLFVLISALQNCVVNFALPVQANLK
jgi:hypothetical protein